MQFDPGRGGSVPLARMTAVVGDRVGTLPKPTRRGYVFVGWYVDHPQRTADAPDAMLVRADSVVDESWLADEAATGVVLVARWDRVNGKEQKKSSLKKQWRAAVALGVTVALLIAAFAIVQVVVDIYTYDDFDGVEYTIKKDDGVYGLYRDGVKCDVNDEGYYVTALGTLLKLDPASGEYEIYAVVDTTDTEVVGVNQRVLMFKQLTYDQSSTNDASRVIKSIAVRNAHGNFTVKRGSNNLFEVDGHPTAVLDTQLFAQLSVGCGYTISMRRLENPLLLANGAVDYAEYGLASEKRQQMDEEGNPMVDETGAPVLYDYVPAGYTVTTMTGDTYSVTLGDATPTGTGYYARYEDRATIYILSSANIDAAVLGPVENLLTPMMVYPMGAGTFFQVSDFEYRSDIDHDGILRDLVLELSGFDLDTVKPDEEGNYPPEAAEKIEEVTAALEDMKAEEFATLYDRIFAARSKLVTAFSFIDMDDRKDTLYSSIPYQMSTDYMAGYLPNSDNISSVLQTLQGMTYAGVVALAPTDDELDMYGLNDYAHEISFIYKDADGQEYSNRFIVSEQTEDGLYYAYSDAFDQIVAFTAANAPYLEWEEIDWYEREYFMANIAHVQTIKLEGAGLPSPITFTLDNSATDQSNGLSADKMVFYANGERISYNLTVTKPSGTVTTETAEYNFRRFYQALLTASVEGNADLDDVQKEALRDTPDDECLLKLTVFADDGKGTTMNHVYRFYRYTERKAYMTIEVLDSPGAPSTPTAGQGNFYVLRSFCDKLIADANRFLNGEEIVVSSKN